MILLTLALVLDWRIGDPDFVWKRIPHPVVLFGRVIDGFDRLRAHGRFLLELDAEERDFWMGCGLVAILFVLAVSVSFAFYPVGYFLGPLYWLPELVLIAVLLAQKSLYEHVEKVRAALEGENIEEARAHLGRIVGRDVSRLDESGVSKAAIESLAESFCDGVMAPVFWYAVLGLPGLVFYKAVNTADSMIGKKDGHYDDFGAAAARADDILNWIPARLSAALIALCAQTFRTRSEKKYAGFAAIIGQVMRDGRLHLSPNAGMSQTAFAAALGIALGGTRFYDGRECAYPPFNAAGTDELRANHIAEALTLFRRTCYGLMALCASMGTLSLF